MPSRKRRISWNSGSDTFETSGSWGRCRDTSPTRWARHESAAARSAMATSSCGIWTRAPSPV